eukprot:5647900-Pyramimonas_sp.AAC.1
MPASPAHSGDLLGITRNSRLLYAADMGNRESPGSFAIVSPPLHHRLERAPRIYAHACTGECADGDRL